MTVLEDRYASPEMVEIWDENRKILLWRKLWLALAEAQSETGLRNEKGEPRITTDALNAMRDAQYPTDQQIQLARVYEKKLKHDVMAHIHAWGEVIPEAKGIIHLGATSCFVTDNADIMRMRDGLDLLKGRLAGIIEKLVELSKKYRHYPCLGYTHYQPASLTTIGKRFCMYLADVCQDLEDLIAESSQLALRGAKGAVGTQDSFLKLFGHEELVFKMEKLFMQKMGFSQVYPITGQTYSRKVDSRILDVLGRIAESASKFGNDLRLLQHDGEWGEAFGADQVGSSAMAFKRNPMLSERLCSISRYLLTLPDCMRQTAANQWLERTLDDSACRRMILPSAFLAADAVACTWLRVLNGLKINERVIEERMKNHSVEWITEGLLMLAVARGADRQVCHEKIRKAIMAIKSGSDLISWESLMKDPDFKGLPVSTNANAYVGMAWRQVEMFITDVAEPLLQRVKPAKLFEANI